MDEQVSSLSLGDTIPETDRVYRIAVDTARARDNKMIPAVNVFSLSEEDKKDNFRLSTDWERMTTPEETITRVGLSFKGDGPILKTYSNRAIYALEVAFLNSLVEIIGVVHNPVLLGDKPIFGRPNNPAHSSICFKQETFAEYEPYIYTKLRDHAKDRKIDVNMDAVKQKVDAEIDAHVKQSSEQSEN